MVNIYLAAMVAEALGQAGDGGPFSLGEKEEAELGAAPNPHQTALCCSWELGVHGGVPPVFSWKQSQRRGSLLPGGLGAGGRATAQEGSPAVYRQVPSSPSCSLGSARLGWTLSAMHKLKASGEARPAQVPDVQDGLRCPWSLPVILFY